MHCNNKFLQERKNTLFKNLKHSKQTYHLSSLFSQREKKNLHGEKLFQTIPKQQIHCEWPCKLKKKKLFLLFFFYFRITTKEGFWYYFLMHIFSFFPLCLNQTIHKQTSHNPRQTLPRSKNVQIRKKKYVLK